MWVRSGNNDKMPGNMLLQDQANINFKKVAEFSVGAEMILGALIAFGKREVQLHLLCAS